MTKFSIFDAHYDILQSPIDEQGKTIVDVSKYSVNMEEMIRNRPMIRDLVSFVHPCFANRGVERANESLDRFYEDYRNYADEVCIIKKACDFQKVINNNLAGVILTIENGSAIQGNLNNIRYFYERGVRMMGITWNADNDLGCGVATQNDTGLTELGKEYVKELNRQKIMIDVSHASPKTVSDVLKISTSPIIASHSCAKSVCDHRRNLTDEQIKEIAQKGGVIGVCFYNPFLTSEGKSSASDIIDHIDYIANVAGINHVGIGTDFQPLEPDELPTNVKSLDDFENIFEGLRKSGYGEDEIAQVAGGNFINVMSKVIENDINKDKKEIER